MDTHIDSEITKIRALCDRAWEAMTSPVLVCTMTALFCASILWLKGLWAVKPCAVTALLCWLFVQRLRVYRDDKKRVFASMPVMLITFIWSAVAVYKYPLDTIALSLRMLALPVVLVILLVVWLKTHDDRFACIGLFAGCFAMLSIATVIFWILLLAIGLLAAIGFPIYPMLLPDKAENVKSAVLSLAKLIGLRHDETYPLQYCLNVPHSGFLSRFMRRDALISVIYIIFIAPLLPFALFDKVTPEADMLIYIISIHGATCIFLFYEVRLRCMLRFEQALEKLLSDRQAVMHDIESLEENARDIRNPAEAKRKEIARQARVYGETDELAQKPMAGRSQALECKLKKIRNWYERIYKEIASTSMFELIFLFPSYRMLKLSWIAPEPPVFIAIALYALAIFRGKNYRKTKIRFGLSLLLLASVCAWMYYILEGSITWFVPYAVRLYIIAAFAVIVVSIALKTMDDSATVLVSSFLLVVFFCFCFRKPWAFIMPGWLLILFIVYPTRNLYAVRKATNIEELRYHFKAIFPIYTVQKPLLKYPTELYPQQSIVEGSRPKTFTDGVLLLPCIGIIWCLITVRKYEITAIYYHIVMMFTVIVYIFLDEVRLYNARKYEVMMEHIFDDERKKLLNSSKMSGTKNK